MNTQEDVFHDVEEDLPDSINLGAAEAAKSALPTISGDRYIRAYEEFNKWRNIENVGSIINEKVMLAYFNQLNKIRKPSCLWPTYSMLRSTISNYHDINIHDYTKLITFIKRQLEGYTPKTAETLTGEQVGEFLHIAPDYEYLAIKVSMRTY